MMFTISEYLKIKDSVERKDEFQESFDEKVSGGNVRFSISGRKISEYYKDIWHGNTYIVHLGADRKANGGYEGCGSATDDFNFLNTFGEFEDRVFEIIGKYGCVRKDEQLCLW